MTGVQKIYIKDGTKGMVEYIKYDEYNSYDEALNWGKKIKIERKNEGKIRYFILPLEDSWFLPTTKFVLYFDRKIKII